MTNRTDQHRERGKLVSIGIKLYPDQLEWLRETYPDNYNAELRRMIDEVRESKQRWDAAQKHLRRREHAQKES